MKTYCILEQSGLPRDDSTRRKRDMFTTSFSDFYRLNWAIDHDPSAFVCLRGLVWSEGRSLLYDQVPKDYAYYIFTDDDIDFAAVSGRDIATTIRDCLDEYRPLTGNFFDRDRFSNPRRWNPLERLALSACLERPAFPIAGYDQQVQFFSRAYADVMFPPAYHGAGGAMWYAQWICYRTFPRKQLCFTDVQVTNTRKEPHLDETLPQFRQIRELVRLFNLDVKDRSYQLTLEQIKANNAAVFAFEPDKRAIDFTLADLAAIYDVDNQPFRERSPVVQDPERYQAILRARAEAG